MVDDGNAATAMLGLPGFVLIAVSELEDEIEQAIQTTSDMVGCPGFGAVAAPHGVDRFGCMICTLNELSASNTG